MVRIRVTQEPLLPLCTLGRREAPPERLNEGKAVFTKYTTQIELWFKKCF